MISFDIEVNLPQVNLNKTEEGISLQHVFIIDLVENFEALS